MIKIGTKWNKQFYRVDYIDLPCRIRDFLSERRYFLLDRREKEVMAQLQSEVDEECKKDIDTMVEEGDVPKELLINSQGNVIAL